MIVLNICIIKLFILGDNVFGFEELVEKVSWVSKVVS